MLKKTNRWRFMARMWWISYNR